MHNYSLISIRGNKWRSQKCNSIWIVFKSWFLLLSNFLSLFDINFCVFSVFARTMTSVARAGMVDCIVLTSPRIPCPRGLATKEKVLNIKNSISKNESTSNFDFINGWRAGDEGKPILILWKTRTYEHKMVSYEKRLWKRRICKKRGRWVGVFLLFLLIIHFYI